MPVDLKGSFIIQNQRNLLGINRTIKNFKENKRNLEKEKDKLRSNFSQQEIPGRFESLNKKINQINQAIERLIEKRNKIEIKVPEK